MINPMIMGMIMYYEREYDPKELLAGNSEDHSLTLPANFIQKLSESRTLQMVLNTFSEWVNILFFADRVSLTINNDNNQLEIFTISGNQAIPLDFKVPVDNSFVGRAYKNKKLMICDDLSKSKEIDCELLSNNGIATCMDAPLLVAGKCIGTLNVGHLNQHYYTKSQAIKLQCLANWIALNISLHLQISEMDKLASTDYLTGIPNRRQFNKVISEKIFDYKSNGKPFFFGILDIDHFKSLNDKYGHGAGDVILKIIAEKITKTIPAGYFFARIGGEEFVLSTMPDISIKSAHNFFNNIRILIEKTIIEYFNDRIACTASIGFTHIHNNDTQIDDIYSRADKALYMAKNSGRNNVKFSP